MRFRNIGALIVALFIGSVAMAQEQRGAIEGTLRDDTGGVLPGASVEAKNIKLGTVQTTYADNGGVYRFPALTPGSYDITASLQGFASSRARAVEVKLGQLLRVDLAMKVGGMEAELVITDEVPLIDVKGSAAAASIRAEQIQKLPRGRDFTTVATQAASANNEADLAGISIDGASGAENRYIIDGIDTTNLQTGQSGAGLITDFIEEVQVKSSGYEAQYGGATGGVINVVTKSGGNDWAGTVGGYYGSSGLDGDVRPTLRLKPTNQDEMEYITYKKDSYTRLEPGLALGGPFVKDRFWFFASYQPSILQTTRPVTFTGATSSEDFLQKVQVHNTTANITGQLSSKLRGRLSGSFTPRLEYGSLPSQDGTSNPIFDYPTLDNKQPNTTISANLDYSASNSLYLGLKGGLFSYNDIDTGVPNEVWRQFNGTNAGFPEIPAELVNVSGYRTIPTNVASTQDIQTRKSLGLDATYFVSGAGDHIFKTGVSMSRIGNDVQSGYQQQRVIFYWDRTLTTLDGRRERGTYGWYRTLKIETLGDIKSNNVGLYLQDAWTVNNKLTLNLGIRTESEKIPSFRTDLGQAENAIDFGFGDKLAPRVGFSYDVKGDGSWKAYGSWGVFYDITKLEMPRGSFGGDRWLDYRYTLDSFDWPNIGGGPCPPTCPGTFLEVIDFRHPANDPGDNTIDPNLEPMRSQEIALGLQHKLNNTTSLGFRYVHKQLDKTIEDVGVIVPGVGEVFFIANPGFGVAEHTIGEEFPAQPKATRKYDGFEVEFTKRMSNNWSLHASYVYSRLFGNYSGLASSDEDGRSSPNVNRFFDGIVMSFDQNANPVFGNLGTDRPHQVKIQALYDFPFGTSVGLNQYVSSGTPISRQVDIQSTLPVFYLGRGSDGRTPMYKQTDFYVQHEFKLGDGSAFQLSLNVENLFDQDTARSIFSDETRDVIGLSDEEFFAGFDVQQKIAEQEIARDARFLSADGFQTARTLRLGMKYVF